MDKLFEKLLDAAVGGLGGAAAKLVPEAWKRRALAEWRERNPLAQIALNHDLLRAVRLAWIEAALDVVKTAEALAKQGEWNAQGEAVRAFAATARDNLRQARTAALDTDRDPGASPIDAHAQAVIDGVAEIVAPAPAAEHGAAIRAAFAETLAALTGWPEAEVPAVFGQVAASGLAVEDGRLRRFGDLVLAAFAEILKSPTRYPEAREAFHIAMEKAARDLAERTLSTVQGIDAKVDAALAGLDRLALARDGLERYLALLPEIAEDVRRIDDRTARIEAKVDALLASERGRSVATGAEARGVSGETLRQAMLRLWAQGLGRDDLVTELESWLVGYEKLRARRVNEDEAFQAALDEAKRRVEAGRLDEASDALMDEFAREAAEEAERQEERRRRRVRLLEEAVRFDELALDGEAAARKLRLMAEIEGASDADARGAWLLTRAGEYYERGAGRGDNPALFVTIGICHAVLNEFTRNRLPLRWSATQNSLGIALLALGERERGTERLVEAMTAFCAALEERPRNCVPLLWAATQSNLGITLQKLGERESGTDRLEQAVVVYSAVLEEYTQELAPLEWARTQNSLGIVLRLLGQREGSPARLEQAVFAHRLALEERVQTCVPLQWAATQNDLGTALHVLGEQSSGTERLQEAAAAYRAALKEYTQQNVPLEWAAAQNNLGNTLRTLSEREIGTQQLEEAIVAFRAALEEFTRERVPLQWAMAQDNLGNALSTLGQRKDNTIHLKQAATAYHAALEEYTQDRVPLHWASTQNNLGNTLTILGEWEGSIEFLEHAIIALRAALEELKKDRVPMGWAMAQNNLGNALLFTAAYGSGVEELNQSVAAYCAALEIRTRDRAPLEWAWTQNNLGLALRMLGERSGQSNRLEEAVTAHTNAMKECRPDQAPIQYAMNIGNLGVALLQLAAHKTDARLLKTAREYLAAALALLRDADHTTYLNYYETMLHEAKTIDIQINEEATDDVSSHPPSPPRRHTSILLEKLRELLGHRPP